jgi:gamma-glutamylaminecyclotransferase
MLRRLFVYDTMLTGEPENEILRGAELVAAAETEAAFHLVDLGAYGALVPGGQTAVLGEVYAVERATCLALDVRREVPILFRRCAVRFADESLAEAYVLSPDQVRGRRRIPSGDWRKRFAPVTASVPRPWSEWARGRRPQ